MPHPVWTAYRIEQHHVSDEGGFLGRHVEHDPRSLGYEVSADLLPTDLKSTVHARNIPILDQGQLGSCTGNDAVGRTGVDPNYDPIPHDNKSKPTGDASGDEKLAVSVYGDATHLDNVPGSYPGQDTGSTGLAAAKAEQKRGTIAGYQHAFNFDTALKALMLFPLGFGCNWYEGMDTPDANGNVAKTGSVRGGHQFTIRELDVEGQRVGCDNSWSTSWGLSGRFYIPFDVFGQLIDEDGDLIAYVPLSEPAPTPTPTPTPADVDAALWDYLKTWATKKGYAL